MIVDITDKAVTEAARALAVYVGEDYQSDNCDQDEARKAARLVLEAAVPHLTDQTDTTAPSIDLRTRARMAVEDALGVELVPLLDAEAITVTASMTEDAADAVLRLVRDYRPADRDTETAALRDQVVGQLDSIVAQLTPRVGILAREPDVHGAAIALQALVASLRGGQ